MPPASPTTAATRTLYFDESGFTGYNLLDPLQPIFVVSSSDIDPETAEAILRRSFPKYQGDEFRFSKIWRSGNKSGLIEFGAQLGALQVRPFSWMTDKRFAVLTKMVDFLIEPMMTRAGYDFYSDGFCWKYVNYIHYGLVEFGESALYDSMVTTYQAYSREPSQETLRVLQWRLRVMSGSLDEPIRMFLEQFADGAEAFERFHNVETFGGSDELHVTTMFALIGHWRKLFPEDFAVIHDSSAHFFRHREMWETITGPDAPEGLHQAGDGTEVQFPLRVTSTQAVDSKDNFAVQLCDIVAGVTARQFDRGIQGDDRALLDAVIQAGLHKLDFNGVRPTAVFPDLMPPRRLTGPDAIDKMMEVVFRKKKPPG